MSTTPSQLGKYELVERLGHGGIAEVWKALDPQLQRHVAVKLLHPNLRDDPSFISRFEREAQLIASLHHPNIVQIHDFQVAQPADSGSDAAFPIAYMVMDYVEGPTLAEYIRNTSAKGLFPTPRTLLNIFTSISLAIDYAHKQGMIHRDIKPANILLDRRNTSRNATGEPILTDFGFAKLMGTPMSTQAGTQSGTPLYMAPEQAQGYPGNERSDLYSLGVILYEVVTGVVPFRGDTSNDVIMQHIYATPPAPALINPAIPPQLAQVIMRNLNKDPAARFPSAASMTAALAEALNLPIPESLGRTASPSTAEEMPTYISHEQFPLSSQPGISSPGTPYLNPSSPGIAGVPSSPGIAGMPFAQTGGNPASTPGLRSQPISGYGNPATPLLTPTPTPPVATMLAPTQVAPASAPATPTNTPPSRAPSRGKAIYAIIAAILIVVILGSSLGAYFLFFHKSAPTPVATNPVAGHAFFVSSGQLAVTTAAGIADEMQIDLQDIPAPQAGNSYYAWLLGDKNPVTSTDLLGPPPIHPPLLLSNNLVVNQGHVHFLYPGDAQHDNLFSASSRLLITEGAANQNPKQPSTDRTTWRYYAEIPQTPIPLDTHHFSALIHIRHLFYNEEGVQVLGLPGGLDIWLFRNTEKILEWAISARDDWSGPTTNAGAIVLIRNQFIRMLDYLDGSNNVYIDVPPGTPILANPRLARVALLTVGPNQVAANYADDPPGYIDHTELHVGQVVKATDITPTQRQLATRILTSLKNAGQWLTELRKDVLLLSNMSDAQLLQPQGGRLLDNVVSLATYAYIGQLDPSTNLVHPGILQTHYDIQQLATFTITKNVPQHL